MLCLFLFCVVLFLGGYVKFGYLFGSRDYGIVCRGFKLERSHLYAFFSFSGLGRICLFDGCAAVVGRGVDVHLDIATVVVFELDDVAHYGVAILGHLLVGVVCHIVNTIVVELVNLVEHHFEKGLSNYPGIYKIINKETARELRGKVTWINRESDMDVPGLREAKLRYHPEYFVKAYYILPEDIPETLR